LVEGGKRRVAVRGEVARAWDRVRDVAPVELRAQFERINRWPNVVWLNNIEALNGSLGELIDVDALFEEFGSEAFVQSRGRPGGARAARAVVGQRKSHAELTTAAGRRLEELFSDALRAHGATREAVGRKTWWERYVAGAFTKLP
jgi:hypothetical protein